MSVYEPELKKALLKFEELLSQLPDEEIEVITVRKYLKDFLRIQTSSLSLPTSEIMAVLKEEKPSIFFRMRNTSTNDPTFHFLTHIDMEYQKAIQSLSELKGILK